MSCIVRTAAIGKLAFTDQTACSICRASAGEPASGERTANATPRSAYNGTTG